MASPPYLFPALAAAAVVGLVLYKRSRDQRDQEADDSDPFDDSGDFAALRPGDTPLPASGGPVFQSWDCASWVDERNRAKHRLDEALAQAVGTPGRDMEVAMAKLQDESADLAIQALGGCGLPKKLIDFGES